MNGTPPPFTKAQADAGREDRLTAACLLAMAPHTFAGLHVRARAGHRRDSYLAVLKALLPAAPWLRSPPHVAEARLLGGLDLAGTLAAGRPVYAAGLLARASGGFLVMPMAERTSPALAARIGHALDQRDVVGRFTLVALDEGIDDERLPDALADRLALSVDLDADIGSAAEAAHSSAIADLGARVATARELWPRVTLDDATHDTVAALSIALDIGSARALTFCAAAIRAVAALDGALAPTSEHMTTAVRLVLLPRARRLPTPSEAPPAETPDAAPETPAPSPDPQALDDVVLAAALATLPPDTLARIAAAAAARRTSMGCGRASGVQSRARHGRPAGIRAGDPTRGDRMDLVATLRTAAPWQSVRRRELNGPIKLERSDFRVKRLVRPTGVTTIFLVDASGSSALHRLAEVKGAVELLLADCYVRRDHVALIAFRNKKAEIVLPPTRALARVKRALAALPGGGATPLASALLAAQGVAADVRRKGDRPDVVVLTDGRANVDRHGKPGRAAAEADAHRAASALRASGIGALVIDTSARPDPASGRLASALGATYLPLPFADARTLAAAVKAAAPRGGVHP